MTQETLFKANKILNDLENLRNITKVKPRWIDLNTSIKKYDFSKDFCDELFDWLMKKKEEYEKVFNEL